MVIIDNGAALSRALDSPLHTDVKRLLVLRRDQLCGQIDDGAHFIVIESRDSLATLETQLALPITLEGQPCFEWATDHHGLFELTFVLSDDGAAQVVLVPDAHGIDPALIALCRLHAADAEAP